MTAYPLPFCNNFHSVLSFFINITALFIEQGMDGEAISLAFATTAGPDCLKEVISKYGLRLKVYQVIKDALSAQVLTSLLHIY